MNQTVSNSGSGKFPVIRVIFDHPRFGYWDGGVKPGGDFKPDPALYYHPGPGHYIEWGCWGLNFWFTAKAGRSWKEAAAIAKRWIVKHCRWPATVEIIWEEVE